MKAAAGALFMLVCPGDARAQAGPAAPADPQVSFSQVTEVPVPLQSTSGRFNSLNPPRQAACQNKKVVGRVVSARLIQVDQFSCVGREVGLPLVNVLVNVRLAAQADAAQMVVGRLVAIEGTLKAAQEPHGGYLVFFVIAEDARPVAGEPIAAPKAAITSYMICQPPELDALASRIGREMCVQNTILANLPVMDSALDIAARALVQDSPKDKSSNDPITCRQDPERSDAHLADIACARGSYWDWWSRKQRGGQNYTEPAPP